MNWRERLRKSFIFFAVGAFAILSLLAPLTTLPERARAQSGGDALFEYRDNTIEVRRTAENRMIASARFKVLRDEIPTNDLILNSIKITMELKKISTDGVFESWQAGVVTFSDLIYGTDSGDVNGSKTINNGRTLQLYDDDDTTPFRVFDYSTRLDIAGYVVINERSVEKLGDYPGVFVWGIGTNNERLLPSGSALITESWLSPMKAFALGWKGKGSIFNKGKIAGETTVPYVAVANYDLSSTGSIESSVSEEKAKSWFEGLGTFSLSIKRFEEGGNPPHIDIGPKATVGRPKLRFVLSHIGSEGSGWFLWKNIDWFIFQAYTVDESGNEKEKIDNLYIVANDNLGINVVYDKDRAGVERGKFVDITDNIVIPNENLNKFYGYTYYNVPEDTNEENCGDEAVHTVGPNGDFKHYDDISGRPDPARELNGNCIVPNQGWPEYWGITVNSVPREKQENGCSFGWILYTTGSGPSNELFDVNVGGTSVTAILNRLTLCIFDGMVLPALEWAAGLVTDAAGLSIRYLHIPEAKPENYYV